MRRKIIFVLLAIIIIAIAFLGWQFFMPQTAFSEKSRFLYIRTGQASYNEVLKTLKDSNFIKNPYAFDWLGRRMGLEQKIKPGRYEIKKDMSLFNIARILRNGRQAPVNLVITKLRTKEDLASLIGRKLECDSTSVMQWVDNTDSLKQYNLDTNIVMTGIFPNTYTYFWNSTPSIVFKKLLAEEEKVWTDERKQLAAHRNLTPATAYILASIVEEETNADREKDTIASVYLNRYNKGMNLQADPTVKFALRDFGLKRIYEKHLTVNSPYNTYRNPGFPPGPICTPSIKTLDAILHSPSTNYLYFVAKSDFSGRHVFSESYEQHLKYAREFQEAQNKLEQKNKPAKEVTGTN